MKILVATDGSESAASALDMLASFPLPAGCELTVLTVINSVLGDEELQQLSEGQRTDLERARQEARQEAEQSLAADVERLRAAGRAASAAVRTGYPPEEIVRAAEELGVDMVVVGSHGLSGIRRFLLGSVSSHVLEAAPCSVLIVKKPEGAGGAAVWKRPWHLLLAYDASEPARKAVDLCDSLPLREDSEVTAVTVMPLVRIYRQDIRQQLDWVWQVQKRAAVRALDRIGEQLGQEGPHVDTKLLESPDVSQAILDMAADRGSDLIVLGHKGKGAIKRFLVGSVTARIAHHAACSVLAVRT